MLESNKGMLRNVKWRYIIILCVLTFIMLIFTFVLGILYYIDTNWSAYELRSFNSRQERIVKEFYGIPENIEVKLLGHRQQDASLRSSPESEVCFYIKKEDIAAYCSMLDKKWISTQEKVGDITTLGKDYKITHCYDGDDIWESSLGEKIIIMENAYDAEDEMVLVYIHHQGVIDGLMGCSRSGDEDEYYKNISGHYDV